MSIRKPTKLSNVERQALLLVQEVRRQAHNGELVEEFGRPAHLAHYLITRYHGHAQLRMSKMTPELGVAMRTLQRCFLRSFHTSMKKYQVATRLRFAQYLLCRDPSLKMSVIAIELGYADPNVFERFFRDHIGVSPNAWRNTIQARSLKDASGDVMVDD